MEHRPNLEDVDDWRDFDQDDEPENKKPLIEPNKPELKLAMAKLLPEKIRVDDDGLIHWIYDPELHLNRFDLRIEETEWLFFMQMVEFKKLKRHNDWHDYIKELCECLGDWEHACSATFNQRATAMRKLKGLTPSPSERSC